MVIVGFFCKGVSDYFTFSFFVLLVKSLVYIVNRSFILYCSSKRFADIVYCCWSLIVWSLNLFGHSEERKEVIAPPRYRVGIAGAGRDWRGSTPSCSCSQMLIFE